MNTNDTETYSKGGYCSPKLEVIDLNLEVGFCQSGTRKAYNEDLGGRRSYVRMAILTLN